MQVYTQDDELIERWQWNDPALRNLSDVVMSLLEGQSGRVLDLGCGSGRLVAELARRSFSVDGIDVEERVIRLAVVFWRVAGLQHACMSVMSTIQRTRLQQVAMMWLFVPKC
jgi:SAM-dependent methyltransferase